MVVDDDEEEWSEGDKDDAGDDDDYSEDGGASEEDDDDASGLEDTDSDDEPRSKKSRLTKGKSQQQKTPAKTPTRRPPLPPQASSKKNGSAQAAHPASGSKLTTPIGSSAQISTPGAPSSTGSTGTNFFDMCSAKKSLGDDTSGESTPRSSTGTALVLPEGVVGLGSHEHNFFEFVQPSKRKDKNGRRPDHPEYNPRTLYVPESFMKSQTPAMAQWWQFKSENMDTVLFFKVSAGERAFTVT
jgi:DNA mismatch repair protein MSH6